MLDPLDVAVIVPAHNAGDYLAQALESALGQSLPPKEVLVVDDGSTDGTAEIAASAGARVRLLRQVHSGVSAARNFGIRSAGHPWLAFLDADDVMAPDRLEVQQRLLAAQPDLEIVLGLQQVFSGARWLPAAADALPARPGLIPSALLCRATTFDRVGLFDAHCQSGEFIDWFARAQEAGVPFGVVNHTVVYRRVHDRNLSRLRIESTDEYPTLLKRLLDRRRAR